MSIFLGKRPADNFVMTPRHWFRDPRLSWKAKGILGYINSHTTGYELTMEQMIAEATDGKDSLYAGLKELEAAGYLTRHRRRDPETGRLGSVDFYLGDPPAENMPNPENRNVGTTSGNAASPQVGPTSGFSMSGESATKKTMSKKTRFEEERTASFVGVRATARTTLDQNSTVDDIEQVLGTLTASEAGQAQAMIEQGRHPRFVYNTLKKRRGGSRGNARLRELRPLLGRLRVPSVKESTMDQPQPQGVTDEMIAEIKARVGPFMLVQVLTGYAIIRTDRFGAQVGGTVGNILTDGTITWHDKQEP